MHVYIYLPQIGTCGPSGHTVPSVLSACIESPHWVPCVYMHVCMYVCMYACMHVCMYAIYACMHIYMYIYMYVYISKYIYRHCIYTYLHMYTVLSALARANVPAAFRVRVCDAQLNFTYNH